MSKKNNRVNRQQGNSADSDRDPTAEAKQKSVFQDVSQATTPQPKRFWLATAAFTVWLAFLIYLAFFVS